MLTCVIGSEIDQVSGVTGSGQRSPRSCCVQKSKGCGVRPSSKFGPGVVAGRAGRRGDAGHRARLEQDDRAVGHRPLDILRAAEERLQFARPAAPVRRPAPAERQLVALDAAASTATSAYRRVRAVITAFSPMTTLFDAPVALSATICPG
jgi:hypothetical protein